MRNCQTPPWSHRALAPAPSCRGRPDAGAAAGKGAADELCTTRGCTPQSGWTATARGPGERRCGPPRCCRPAASEALRRQNRKTQKWLRGIEREESCCRVAKLAEEVESKKSLRVSFTWVDLVEGVGVQTGSCELEDDGQRATSEHSAHLRVFFQSGQRQRTQLLLHTQQLHT